MCFPGALLGTSPIIIHNETVAGISDGARTGLHSVTVAALFILSIPFVPLLRSVPPIAAAAPLVIVGMCMMSSAKFIDWEQTHEAMPAFLCATLLPYTYSIANGMIVGILAYAVLKSSHKLGEVIAPTRFHRPPRCTAKDTRPPCECEECIALAHIAVIASSAEATPRYRAHRKEEFFEDPMVGHRETRDDQPAVRPPAGSHSCATTKQHIREALTNPRVYVLSSLCHFCLSLLPQPGAPTFPFASSSPLPPHADRDHSQPHTGTDHDGAHRHEATGAGVSRMYSASSSTPSPSPSPR